MDMWCPKCRYEFKTAQKKCFNCGRKLVELPDKPLGKAYVYLTTCKDEFEFQLRLSLLSSCGISAVRAYTPENVEFIIFQDNEKSRFGNDIYVQADRLPDAREILKEQTEN